MKDGTSFLVQCEERAVKVGKNSWTVSEQK